MPTLPTVSVLLAIVAASLHLAPLPGRPIQQPEQGVVIGDSPAPPATVQQLVQQTPYLILGRVKKVLPTRLWFGRNRSAPDDNPNETKQVVQPIDVEVLEVIRDEGKVIGDRKSVVVLQWGGSVEVGGRLHRTIRSTRTPIQEGEELILFLGPSEQNSFVPKFGSAGVLVIRPTGHISIPPALSRTAGFAGNSELSREAVLSLLKGASK